MAYGTPPRTWTASPTAPQADPNDPTVAMFNHIDALRFNRQHNMLGQHRAAPISAPVRVITDAQGNKVFVRPDGPTFVGTGIQQPQAATVPAPQPITQPMPQAAAEYAMPAAPQAVQSITSAQTLAGQHPMPVPQSTSNVYMQTPSPGLAHPLDVGVAADDVAQRYAALLAAGQAPVLSDNLQAALNRRMARNSLALSAATNAADTNAAYRAMSNPDTRNRAQEIASTQGVSFDTAMKMATAGALAQQGNYALANRYEGSTLLPAMQAENQRRVTMALEAGTDMPALTDYLGNTFNSSGINSVYETGDGETVRFNTPYMTATGTPNAAVTAGRLAQSTAPMADAFAMRAGNTQNVISAARGQQQAAAAQAKMVGENAMRQQTNYTRMAEQAARIQKAKFDMAAAQLRGTSAVAPRAARTDTPAQQAQVLISAARNLPEDDPQRAALLQQAAVLVGGKLTEEQ